MSDEVKRVLWTVATVFPALLCLVPLQDAQAALDTTRTALWGVACGFFAGLFVAHK